MTYTSAVHVAHVDVDPGTGAVRLLRYVVAHDCGRLINPVIVEGQIHGGVAQGVGGALLEEMVYDEQGQLLTGTFMDYLVPTAMELPPSRPCISSTRRRATLWESRASARAGPSRLPPPSPMRSRTRWPPSMSA